MDILKDKQSKYYDYLSRYASFPIYFNTLDKKFMTGLTAQLSKETSYVVVKVDASTTLDFLANKYYGRPDYFWVIADFNDITDPFITLSDYFTDIKVPSLASVSFEGI